MAKNDEFPVTVRRYGSLYRISTEALVRDVYDQTPLPTTPHWAPCVWDGD